MKRLCLSKWGLIGNYKIDQYSLAPIMWRKLFRRLNMPVKYFVIGSDRKKTIIDKIELLTQDDNFIGANIAVPWKGLAYNLCDKTYLFNELDVVNTIVKNNRNELIGYNSDGEGLVNGIKKCTNVKGKTIVIIGSGGSAQTIPLYLLKGGVKPDHAPWPCECGALSDRECRNLYTARGRSVWPASPDARKRDFAQAKTRTPEHRPSCPCRFEIPPTP